MVSPTQSFGNAASAYANTARAAGAPAAKGMDARDTKAREGFGDLVRNALQDAVNSGKNSEKMSMNAISDRADINDVVTAVAEAELTLQTVVSVRDKVIEAYKEIIRMPM